MRTSLYKLHPLVALALVSITLMAIALSLLQFRFSLGDMPTVVVRSENRQPIHPLDKILADNLAYLGQSEAFRDLLIDQYQHSIQPIAMQQCKTTQSEFNAFAQWLQFQENENVFAHPDAPLDEIYRSRFLEHSILGKLNAPVTGVNLYQAHAYCAAAGGRLPRSSEWEVAASGVYRRIYPWSNVFNGSPWQHRNPLLNVANGCNQTPEAITPEGIAAMGGASSEWTTRDDTHQTEQFIGMLRGGNALNRPFALHSLNFIAKPAAANFSSQFVSFRCVFDQVDVNEITTPWGNQHKVVPIKGGEYALGVPEDAKLPRLIRELGMSISELRPLIAQFSREQSQQQQLRVGKYEVTVGYYAKFLRDPLVRVHLYANSAQPSGHSYIPLYWEQQKQFPNNPVVGVSFWDAYAFARWVGGRLPTLDEWNWLFSGGTAHLYPWGSDYQSDLAIVRDLQVRDAPVAVDQSLDQSLGGIFAMAGNVSEWTASSYFSDGQQTMVIKGGNYLLEGQEAARIDYVARAPNHHRSVAVGFRVVFDE